MFMTSFEEVLERVFWTMNVLNISKNTAFTNNCSSNCALESRNQLVWTQFDPSDLRIKPIQNERPPPHILGSNDILIYSFAHQARVLGSLFRIGKYASICKLVRCPFSGIAPSLSFCPGQAGLSLFFAWGFAPPLYVLFFLYVYCNCVYVCVRVS